MATVAVVSATFVACSARQSPTTPSPPSPREPIQNFLRQRSAALNAGDVEGYLAPLSAEARAIEEPIARGALSVPLERIDLTVGAAQISDDGTRFDDAMVTFLYRYKDLPEDNLFRFQLSYDIERRDEGWVVTSSAAEGLPLWASGEVTVTRSAHFLVLARPGTPRTEESVALAEDGRAELVPRLTLQPDQVHLLILGRNDDVYRQAGGNPEREPVAFARWTYQSSAAYPARPEDRHMVVNLSHLFDPSRQARSEGRSGLRPQQVMTHELARLALSRFERPATPAWVSEGGAMLLAEERLEAEWAAMAARGTSQPWSLAALVEMLPTPEAYAFALAAVRHLVDTRSRDTFFDFFQNFKEFTDRDVQETLAVRAEGAERLLRRYYRFGNQDLDRSTSEWIRRAAD